MFLWLEVSVTFRDGATSQRQDAPAHAERRAWMSVEEIASKVWFEIPGVLISAELFFHLHRKLP
jgi:hypothetical protein